VNLAGHEMTLLAEMIVDLSSVFAGTRSFAGGLFTTVMFLYFLLVSGDRFLRRLAEVLPKFASKRQAVDISQQIGRDISAYLLTITLMNALVGAATALVIWSTGVGDPVLWGTVAFILNYVPILGPAAAIFIFLFAGSLTITSTWQGVVGGLDLECVIVHFELFGHRIVPS
jgi:predicted PurR-regulated permease PerM